MLNNLPRVLQLIQLGAPLDLGEETYGSSALGWACTLCHVHVAEALLDGKYEGRLATVDVRDAQGSTPLIDACSWDRDVVVRLLLSRGAKVELQDDSGETAFHWAARNGNLGIATTLCSAPGAAAALALKDNIRGETPLAHALSRGEINCAAIFRLHGATE